MKWESRKTGMSIVHVLPIDDFRLHIEQSTCECQPRVEVVEGGMIVVHHSWDNREVIEQVRSLLSKQEERQ